MSATTPTSHEILKNVFGYDSFRPMQENIVNHVLHKKDALVIMPTGGGKSLCFQIPALIMDGLAIVVSPLIALMEDQVQALVQNGVPAVALNSALSHAEQMDVFNKIHRKEIKLLYVSPERINNERFYQFLSTITISFFAIDEAHCVSMWGNDFRSDYVQLKNLKEKFPTIPLIALTATADEATREDIKIQLNIPEAKLFLSSFERNNLLIKALPAKDRVKYIVRFIFNQQGGAGIVYCLSRKSTEKMSAKLNEAGIASAFYHAGMSNKDRSQVQRRFQNDEIQVICATIAFGMGIDKPNIRFVVHYNMPKNIESYYQEIGRAGRDGETSATILFSNYNDYLQQQRFIEESQAQKSFQEVQLAKLERMWQFASSYECRTNFLLNYFGEYRNEPCGRCDNCKNPPRKFDGTILAQKAMSAIYRSREQLTVDVCIAVLRGQGFKEIFERRLNEIKTYGAGRDLPYLDWKTYIIQMINQGLLSIDFTDKNHLKLTPLSQDVLYNKQKVELVEFQRQQEKKEKPTTKKVQVADALLDKLREWRNQKAKEANVPAYIIVNNTALEELASAKPLYKHQLMDITGIGQAKLDRYGEEIIQLIQQFAIETEKHFSLKGSTHLVTLHHYKKGLSPQEIALERTFSETTIMSHLAQLYLQGEDVDLMQYLPQEKLPKIREVWEKLNYSETLKELKAELPEEYSYADIRIGITILKREKEETN